MLSGTVSEFDDAVGLGLVTLPSGEEYQFHCIEIVDGTRSIAVGASVTFDLLPRFGQMQAGSLVKL